MVLRDVTTADAAFILGLRTNSRKARHLSSTPADLDRQIEWIKAYALAKDQAYFLIEDGAGMSIGTVRLYDLRGDSFCWGSWIISDGAPQNAAIESALMVYAYAIDHLGFKRSHFDVRKGNESVWKFHERFGARRVGETEQDYLYEIGSEEISSARHRYRKFLPEGVVVEMYP